MMNDFDHVVSAGKIVGNLARAVKTTIVNNNYFKVGVKLFQDSKCLFYYTGDIVLFVIAGGKNADRNITLLTRS